MTINVVSFERYPGARKYSADAMATFEFYVVRVADERGHWIGVL